MTTAIIAIITEAMKVIIFGADSSMVLPPKPHKRGRLFRGRVDRRRAGKNSWLPPFWFQAGAQTFRLSQSPWACSTVSGDSITLHRVRLESEYLVSQCGTFPRNCSINGGEQI